MKFPYLHVNILFQTDHFWTLSMLDQRRIFPKNVHRYDRNDGYSLAAKYGSPPSQLKKCWIPPEGEISHKEYSFRKIKCEWIVYDWAAYSCSSKVTWKAYINLLFRFLPKALLSLRKDRCHWDTFERGEKTGREILCHGIVSCCCSCECSSLSFANESRASVLTWRPEFKNPTQLTKS